MAAFISFGKPKFSEAKLPPQHETPATEYAIIERINTLHESVLGDYMKRRSRGFIGHVLLSAQGVSSPWHQQNMSKEYAVDVFTPIAPEPEGFDGVPVGEFKRGLGGAFTIDGNTSFQFWPDTTIELTIGQMQQNQRTGEITMVDDKPVSIELNLPAQDSEGKLRLRHSALDTGNSYFLRITGLPAHDTLNTYNAGVASGSLFRQEDGNIFGLSSRHSIIQQQFMNQGMDQIQAHRAARKELKPDFDVYYEVRARKTAEDLGIGFDEGSTIDQKNELIEQKLEELRHEAESEKENVLALVSALSSWQ